MKCLKKITAFIIIIFLLMISFYSSKESNSAEIKSSIELTTVENCKLESLSPTNLELKFTVDHQKGDTTPLQYTLPKQKDVQYKFKNTTTILKDDKGAVLAEVHFNENSLSIQVLKLNKKWKKSFICSALVENQSSVVQKIQFKNNLINLYPKEIQRKSHKDDQDLFIKLECKRKILFPNQESLLKLYFGLPKQRYFHKGKNWFIQLPSFLKIDPNFKEEKNADIYFKLLKNNQLEIQVQKDELHWKGQLNCKVKNTTQQPISLKELEKKIHFLTIKDTQKLATNKKEDKKISNIKGKTKEVKKAIHNKKHSLISNKKQSLILLQQNRSEGRLLNDSGVVESITLSPDPVQNGQDVRLSIHVQEKKENQIQPNDKLIFKLPNNGSTSLVGYKKDIDVIYGDRNIGRLVVSGNQATLTFNDEVAKLSDVYADIDFLCQAHSPNEAGKTYPCTSDFGIPTLKPVRFSIFNPVPSGGPNPFYYKTGAIQTDDTNHVQWWLNGNCNSATVDGDFWIEDEIGPGQDLVPSSFLIYFVTGPLRGNSYSIEDFETQNLGNISVTDSKKKFTVYVPKSTIQNSNFVITYKTKITNMKLAKFHNNSHVWYTIQGKPPVIDHQDENTNASVDNISIDATGGGKDAIAFYIDKVGSDNLDEGIGGVTFVLENKKTGEKLTAETDASGLATWKSVSPGMYILTERDAPKPYRINPKQYLVQVKDGVANILNPDKQLTYNKSTGIWQMIDYKKNVTPLMPNTGGEGVILYLILGILSIGIAWKVQKIR